MLKKDRGVEAVVQTAIAIAASITAAKDVQSRRGITFLVGRLPLIDLSVLV